MKIEKISNIVCDIKGCSNIACRKFYNLGDKSSLNLCKNCMFELNKLIMADLKSKESLSGKKGIL